MLGHRYIFPDVPQPHRGNRLSPPRLVCNCGRARDRNPHSVHWRTGCSAERLHLELLSTCRQTYTEVFPILWSTNFFCFDKSETMSLVFQNLLPHQKALIRNVRIDMNKFVTRREWTAHFKVVDLKSLQDLRRIQLVTCTNVSVYSTGRSVAMVQQRKPRLVKSVLRLRAHRPALTVVVIRNGRIYRRLNRKSRMGKLLERV